MRNKREEQKAKGALDHDGSLVAGKEEKEERRIDRKSLRPWHSSEKFWARQMSNPKAKIIIGGAHFGQKPRDFRTQLYLVAGWRCDPKGRGQSVSSFGRGLMKPDLNLHFYACHNLLFCSLMYLSDIYGQILSWTGNSS